MRKRVVAVFALLVVVGVAWWFGSSGSSTVPEPAPSKAPAVTAVVPPPTSKPAPIPPEDELPEPVRAYLAQTVYPPDSGRLDQAGDIFESNPRFERFKRVPGSHGSDPDITFLWTADAFRYTSDETVKARFEAKAGELPAQVRHLEAWAQAEGSDGSVGAPIGLLFRSDGAARVAELDLSKHLEDHHGFVVLGVRYTVADVAEQQEQIRVFVTPEDLIPAAFTGTFRDNVSGGSLEIEVGVEVYEPGFYRFDANLYGAAGEPVAWAAFKGELSRSDGVVPLRFFGRVLHDLGFAGPYQLKQLRGYLFRDGLFPDRIHLRDYLPAHTTRDFALTDFSEAEWDSEHRRHMVELMMQDEAAGIPVEMPTLPTDGGETAPDDAL